MISKSINADGGVGMTVSMIPTYDMFNSAEDGDEIAERNEITRSIDTGYYSTDYAMTLPILNVNLQKFIGKSGKLG